MRPARLPDNQAGKVKPRRDEVRFTGGFSALDLIIVFAVTAICVTLGGPLIHDYSVRVKMVEALLAADGIKTAITITCTSNPTIPELKNEALGYWFEPSKYVQSVNVDGTCARPKIRVLTINTGAPDDPALLISGVNQGDTSNLIWKCASDSEDIYMPEECRRLAAH